MTQRDSLAHHRLTAGQGGRNSIHGRRVLPQHTPYPAPSPAHLPGAAASPPGTPGQHRASKTPSFSPPLPECSLYIHPFPKQLKFHRAQKGAWGWEFWVGKRLPSVQERQAAPPLGPSEEGAYRMSNGLCSDPFFFHHSSPSSPKEENFDLPPASSHKLGQGPQEARGGEG